jgi:hypothetical protein
MDIRELVSRAARRTGAGEDAAGELVDAFLHELGTALEQGATIALGDLGTFRDTAFAPGPALAGARGAAFSDTEGYDEGSAPSDS